MRRGTVNLVKNFMIQKINKAQQSGFVDGSMAGDLPNITQKSMAGGRNNANQSVAAGGKGGTMGDEAAGYNAN